MVEPIGRREVHRQATREAIVSAARRLFAAQGYEGTSVREIAEAAGIGERTFYRYYDGKDGLLVGELDAWLQRVSEAIRRRPAGASALRVVRDAMADVRAGGGAEPAVGWLLGSQPRPLEFLRRSAPRPLRRFEQAIEGALIIRSLDLGLDENPLRADLSARICVAVIRSAAGRVRIGADDGSTERSFWAAVDTGFEAIDQIVAAEDRPGVPPM